MKTAECWCSQYWQPIDASDSNTLQVDCDSRHFSMCDTAHMTRRPIFSGSVSSKHILKSVPHNDGTTDTQSETESYFPKDSQTQYILLKIGLCASCIDDKKTKSI